MSTKTRSGENVSESNVVSFRTSYWGSSIPENADSPAVAVLIDGHHIWLEALRVLDKGRRHRNLGEFVSELFGDEARLALTVADFVFALLSKLKVWLGTFEPDRYGGTLSPFLFDKPMPRRSVAMRALRDGASRLKHRGFVHHQIERLNSGLWQPWYDRDTKIVVPYYAKNIFIQALADEFADEFDVAHGTSRHGDLTKQIEVNLNGGVIEKEKGVDASLVVRMCRIAVNPARRAVVIISNDGDHQPAMQFCRQSGKRVFLLPIARRERIARSLDLEADRKIDPAELHAALDGEEMISRVQDAFRPGPPAQGGSPEDSYVRGALSGPIWMFLLPALLLRCLGPETTRFVDEQRANEIKARLRARGWMD